MDPHLALALCQAYNNWIHEFTQHSPDQLKWAAMLPMQDINMACSELVRCVNELGAVGSFVRPNAIDGHFGIPIIGIRFLRCIVSSMWRWDSMKAQARTTAI
tara:strand:- start:628 stop:933 length:306 start_codon:yes stop_codon:yes gene_type:complete